MSWGRDLGEIERWVLFAAITAHRFYPRWGVTLNQVEAQTIGLSRKQIRQALHRLTVKRFLQEQNRQVQGFRWWAPQPEAYQWFFMNRMIDTGA